MGTELAERRVEDPYGSEEMTPARAAWLIVKSYPNRPDKDGDAYIRQVSVLLNVYPEWVRRKAVHPELGIVGKCNWLPTPHEIREYCRDEMKNAAKLAAAKERQQLPEPDFHVSPEERAKCVERAKAVCAEIRATADSMTARKPRPGVQRTGDPWAGIRETKLFQDAIAEKEMEE